MFNKIGEYNNPLDEDIEAASWLLQKEIEDIQTYEGQIDSANDESLKFLYAQMRDTGRRHADILAAWLGKSREIFEKKLYSHN